jgi:hypothetical protein
MQVFRATPTLASSIRCCVAAGALAAAVAGCGSGSPAASQREKASGAPGQVGAETICPRRAAFELSLASRRGGRPTPVAAADWFAQHGGIRGMPRTGWRLIAQTRGGATVVSGRTGVHVLRGTDGTWQVDSGYTCG